MENFNSQPRKGADPDYMGIWDVISISTHSPARGLTDRDALATSYHHFNSQPRKGADDVQGLWEAIERLFQLTAPQGG